MSREFTYDFKCKALKLVEERNGNINEAAEILKISPRLLAIWERRKTLLKKSYLSEKDEPLVHVPGNNAKQLGTGAQRVVKRTADGDPGFPNTGLRPVSQAWDPGYRRRHGLFRRPYTPEKRSVLPSGDSGTPPLPEDSDASLPMISDTFSLLKSEAELPVDDFDSEMPVEKSTAQKDRSQSPADNSETQTSTKASASLFTLLTTIQRLISDTLKFTRHQVGTMYPIEVEMGLPESIEYCKFDLLKPLTGNNKSPGSVSFTVLLSAVATGAKLKPVMLVKGNKNLLDRSKFPQTVEVNVTGRLTFTMKTFSEWKQNIWLKREKTRFDNSLVIIALDETDSAMTPIMENVGFLHENTMVAAVPKSLIHLVHPAIVFWITPFAETLQVRLQEWLTDAEREFTTLQEKRTLSYALFADWISEAWMNMDSGLIAKSFEACGLTNFTPTNLHPALQQFLDLHKNKSLPINQPPLVDVAS